MIQKESLRIKHFGPIKEVNLEEVKPFTFFIGESGSGKSTILKVLALMRHMYKQLNLRSYLKLGNVIRCQSGMGIIGRHTRNLCRTEGAEVPCFLWETEISSCCFNMESGYFFVNIQIIGKRIGRCVKRLCVTSIIGTYLNRNR